MNWEKYIGDQDYNENIQYWYEEWRNICDLFEHGMIGIEIVNIRIILSDIINEYELNRFQNDNNRKIYIKLIEKMLPRKHLRDKYRSQLLLLKGGLEKKEKQYSYVIAKDIQEALLEEHFAFALFDELCVSLKETPSSKELRGEISRLSRELIVELITSGQSIDEIKNYLWDAFRDESDIFVENDIDEDYDDATAKKGQANISERLDILREKMSPKRFNYTFVFPLFGAFFVPGVPNEESIMGCYLYNPENEKAFPEINDEFIDESFHDFYGKQKENANDNTRDKGSRCNAKISVSSVSKSNAAKLAQEKLARLVNCLHLDYSSKYKDIFSDHQYIGKNIDKGEYHTFSFANEAEMRASISHSNTIELDSHVLSDMKRIDKMLQTLDERKMYFEINVLDRAIALLSKSRYISDEDRLVNYWIVLESLMSLSKDESQTKFDLIKGTVANIYFLSGRYEPLRDLFRLTSRYAAQYLRKKDGEICISQDFIKKTGIEKTFGGVYSISLKPFYECIDELVGFTTKPIFLDRITDTIAFYRDGKTALERMKEEKESVELTISYIYKCRNQIVHNGYVDQNLIPHLVSHARGYANSLLSRIMSVYQEDRYDLHEHFLRESYQARLLTEKMQHLSSQQHFIFDEG